MKLQNLIHILMGIVCIGLLPKAQAVSPPPDGCYPGFTTAEGCQALQNLTTGSANTGVGFRALFSAGASSFNTGVGAGALVLNTGDANTAVGAIALLLNTDGSDNTAVGVAALENNSTGNNNTANGAFALFSNTTGGFNTATGFQALEDNIVDGNTATGAFALFANTTGGTLETVTGYDLGPNTAIGAHALEMNVDGSANTAVGYNALHSQVHGDVTEGEPQLAANTAVGFEALANVTGSATGYDVANTALGYQALFDLTDGQNNVAVGFQAGFGLTNGDGNINVGYLAGIGNVTGSGNIFIGTGMGPSLPNESAHTYIDNINFTSLPFAGNIDVVTIDLNTGLLGHNSSSRRYKEDIKPMDKASEALYRLKPVTYRVKKQINSAQPTAFGLIAEEVAGVNPALIVRNAQGQVEGVHYEMVNAMLLNEFLKEHRKVERLEKQVEALTAGLQKVTARFELSKPAPQTVKNKD